MKKRNYLALLAIISVLFSGISVYASSNGAYISGNIYGAVVASFSSNYGVYSGTISEKPDGVVKVVGYKHNGANYSEVKSVILTAYSRSAGFKKSVGKNCKKIKCAITISDVSKVKTVETR